MSLSQAELEKLPIVAAETYEQRLERMYEYEDKNHKYPNVIAVLTKPEGLRRLKQWILTHNLVTDAGDTYHAQKVCGETPTNDFAGASGRIELRTTADTPAKGDQYQDVLGKQTATRKAIFSGYPKSNDADTDNTATNKQRKSTWRWDWATGDFNLTGIVGGCTHAGGTSPGATAALHRHFTIASFDKTGTDTLKLLVNDDFLGA